MTLLALTKEVEVDIDLDTSDVIDALEAEGYTVTKSHNANAASQHNKMHTPEPHLIEDMMRAARFYDQAHFNQLAQEFYQACQR